MTGVTIILCGRLLSPSYNSLPFILSCVVAVLAFYLAWFQATLRSLGHRLVIAGGIPLIFLGISPSFLASLFKALAASENTAIGIVARALEGLPFNITYPIVGVGIFLIAVGLVQDYFLRLHNDRIQLDEKRNERDHHARLEEIAVKKLELELANADANDARSHELILYELILSGAQVGEIEVFDSNGNDDAELIDVSDD